MALNSQTSESYGPQCILKHNMNQHLTTRKLWQLISFNNTLLGENLHSHFALIFGSVDTVVPLFLLRQCGLGICWRPQVRDKV